MGAAGNWLIIGGILLLVIGIVLRTILMMRSSDATARDATALHGRALLKQYELLHPASLAPRLMHGLLIGGTALLLAGIGVVIAR